ncbi:unnamed protein product [Caenorhabditis bovis]|uniref:YitH/HolE acetyltransferase (GNAT) domain-containing protein n=1 Tax=Caenorhabditis bovis TaxID=2654633 RepID=A0A8S1F303_9PELO|nr:unnamed protein product [Caenorhabditis bovis]
MDYYISFYEMKDIVIPDTKYDDIVVKNIKDAPISDFVTYDRDIFPYERSDFVKAYIQDKAAFARVAYDKNGKVIGIGAVVAYPSGECVIAPMYCDNMHVARAIFTDILREMPLEKLWRFHIRSHNKHDESFEWIKPFIRPQFERKHLAKLLYSLHEIQYVDIKRIYAFMPITNYPL